MRMVRPPERLTKIFFARLSTDKILEFLTARLNLGKNLGLAMFSLCLLSLVERSVQTSKIFFPTTVFLSPRTFVSFAGGPGILIFFGKKKLLRKSKKQF